MPIRFTNHPLKAPLRYLYTSVYKFTPDGKQTTISDAFSLEENNGLACDSADNLFVADGNGNIYRLTPAGVQSTFAQVGSGVNGLVFNSAGDLLVANGDTIYEFTPAGVQSTFASGLGSNIGDLAINSAGDLFAAVGNAIYEFTPDGAQSTFASSLLSMLCSRSRISSCSSRVMARFSL